MCCCCTSISNVVFNKHVALSSRLENFTRTLNHVVIYIFGDIKTSRQVALKHFFGHRHVWELHLEQKKKERLKNKNTESKSSRLGNTHSAPLISKQAKTTRPARLVRLRRAAVTAAARHQRVRTKQD